MDRLKLKKPKKWGKKAEFSVRGKIIFTLAILLAFRVLAQIPLPAVNTKYLEAMVTGNGALGFLNLMTGNSLEKLSFMSLSISPYITASIIVQLMEVVFPSLEELRKDGKTGADKYKKITYAVAAAMALIQSLAMGYGFSRQGIFVNSRWYIALAAALFWTMGAVAAVVFGEAITKKGIGNGISLLLLANILSSFPSGVKQIYDKCASSGSVASGIFKGVLVAIAVFAAFMFVSLLQLSEKKIHVIYSAKGPVGKQSHVIPLKLCPGSVVPIIFASTLMGIPSLVYYFLGKEPNAFAKFLSSEYWFKPSDMKYSFGIIVYIALIFGFSYFYNAITANPKEIADNIRKGSGTIPGIRNGRETEKYIESQANLMTFWGAAGLSVVAVIPIAAGGLFGLGGISFLGTSIIITVGVILETRKTLEAATKMYTYKNKRIFA